jgi:protein gp37
MSDKSKIEWCDSTWNPVTGCTKVSEGCRNCYALTFAERWRGTAGHYFENGFDITLRPDKLDQPLKWRRPRRIFVNSMSDLFHKDVPDDFIEKVFRVMCDANQHTYQVLTKRPERMLDWMQRYGWNLSHTPHIWFGVSVENQQAANDRIPLLLHTPAAVRFLSCEPLLGSVDLMNYLSYPMPMTDEWGAQVGADQIRTIDWVIVGGESGHKARPMHPEWVRSLRDQCQEAGVPFFFKQWGEWSETGHSDKACTELAKAVQIISLDGKDESGLPLNEYTDRNAIVYRFGKKAAGRLLDGREWNEYPEVTI